MVILIDTNIILDVLCQRNDFYKDSANIFRLCEIKKLYGVVSTLSFANISYIMRKEYAASKIGGILERLSFIFDISDLTVEDLKRAAALNFKDYEDAIQCACALRSKADYIISRNTKDFTLSKIPAITPKEFLEIFNYNF